MHLSVETVMHHSVSICRKLAVRGRADATAYEYDLATIVADGC